MILGLARKFRRKSFFIFETPLHRMDGAAALREDWVRSEELIDAVAEVGDLVLVFSEQVDAGFDFFARDHECPALLAALTRWSIAVARLSNSDAASCRAA